MDTTKKKRKRTSKPKLPKEVVSMTVETVMETKEPEVIEVPEYKLNLSSNNMYECIGITAEETAKLFNEIKDIMRQPIRKAEKTQMLFDLINKDPKAIATICWVTVRI